MIVPTRPENIRAESTYFPEGGRSSLSPEVSPQVPKADSTSNSGRSSDSSAIATSAMAPTSTRVAPRASTAMATRSDLGAIVRPTRYLG